MRWIPPKALRRVFYIFLVAGYVSIELDEHSVNLANLDLMFLVELVLFLVPLILTIVLFESLLRTMAHKEQAVNLLDTKHKLSLQLAEAQSWDELISHLAELPRSFIPQADTCLLIYNPDLGGFELADRPAVTDCIADGELLPLALEICDTCALKKPFQLHPVQECVQRCGSLAHNGNNLYCLPLVYHDAPLALWRLSLPPGYSPSREQFEILNNIGPEMAVALAGALAYQSREQLALSQATEKERRSIARELHDTLGQNLTLLRMKLEQFALNLSLWEENQARQQLERMTNLADETSDLMRGILVILHQEDTSHYQLCELLRVQGKTITSQTDIEISVHCDGKTRLLPPHAIRQVYYAYKEALTNVIRHAGPCRVSVDVKWSDDGLTLQITDDGCGFDPGAVDQRQHFGQQIMRERIESLNGKFSLTSVVNSGTRITFWLPF